MIKIAVFLSCAFLLLVCQDALLAPQDPFALRLNELATYHQDYLIEIDPQRYRPEWSSIFAHQAALEHSVVEIQFHIVHKHHPEKQGQVLSKCRLEDQSKRWCKIESQGINFNNYLIKVRLDCVSDCRGNITIGFASRQWGGEELPKVFGAPLEWNQANDSQSENKFVLLKIIGWMVLTLVLILLAIQFGEKIANKFDSKIQEDRQSSLKQKRIYTKDHLPHKKKE